MLHISEKKNRIEKTMFSAVKLGLFGNEKYIFGSASMHLSSLKKTECEEIVVKGPFQTYFKTYKHSP